MRLLFIIIDKIKKKTLFNLVGFRPTCISCAPRIYFLALSLIGISLFHTYVMDLLLLEDQTLYPITYKYSYNYLINSSLNFIGIDNPKHSDYLQLKTKRKIYEWGAST